jgi:GNAT superfamily N-acetyltransferase
MSKPTFINNLGFSDTYGSTSKAVDKLFDSNQCRTASNGMTIIRIGQDHKLLEETLSVLGLGECGTSRTAPDPLLDWVYSGTELQSNCKPLGEHGLTADRIAWFKWMATYCGYFAMARGGLFALVDPKTGRVLAAAATGPPKTVSFGRMSGGEMGDWIRIAGMTIGIDILANNLRMRALGAWQNGVQESQHLPPHLYVVMFATHPDSQGKGCGKALLNFLGEVADADGVVAFLETAGARNCGFYNTGGYVEVSRSAVAGFVHEGGGVGMKRLPRGGTTCSSTTSDTPLHHHVTTTTSADAVKDLQKVGAAVLRPCSFSAKRSTGPLSKYCKTCSGHFSTHTEYL